VPIIVAHLLLGKLMPELPFRRIELKEKSMNVARFSALLAAALLSTAAFAQGTQASDKTRAEVHQELLKAQHDGTIPAGKLDYPPSAETVARNKELHDISKHGGEEAHALDNHDLGSTAAAR
jgi:hypothetical protein